MGGLYLEDFVVGRVVEHAIRRTVTEMDNMLFSCLTHNPQPLHIDHHFAAQTEWGRPLVNSLFTLGLMIGVSVGDTTLGTTIGNLGMTDVKFPKPVFHGDTLRVTTEVLAKRDSHSRKDAGIVEFLHRGLQPARRDGRRVPAAGHDAQETEGLTHALASVRSRRQRAQACQGRGLRRRHAAPRSGGRGERLAQAGGARDGGRVHPAPRARTRAARASTCASTRSTPPTGRTTSPA